MPQVTVVHWPALLRYEVRVDDLLAGYSQYRLVPGSGEVEFLHTNINTRYEGQGVGSQLVAGALDLVRASGRRAIAACPFVAAFVTRHREYADMMTER
jgi:uncharacterized protein